MRSEYAYHMFHTLVVGESRAEPLGVNTIQGYFIKMLSKIFNKLT